MLELLAPNETIKVKLSKREVEIITLLSHEFTSHEVATQLNISPRTVEGHKQTILKKTGKRCSVGIIMFGIRSGIIAL
ncbi:MAG: response regulator transcription factor [Bacteroidetes bacterium]|nr:response regulator transcription factor [Bacteroidota bacterium]HET6243543.1 LuxR C-terminal-related transcriptional regulator [Bacteroidia bacterium]